MRVGIDWDKSFEAIGAKLTDRGRRVRRFAEARIEHIANNALKTVKELTPTNTGKLKDGWAIEREELGSGRLSFGVSYKLVNKDPRARAIIVYKGGKTTLLDILEYGTSPHVIRARNKKSLRFEVDGVQVVTKKVFHPGTRPYAMVRTAHLEATREAVRAAAQLQSMIGGALTKV